MRNVSNEYIQTMDVRRDFYPEAEITFSDGTKKNLTKNDFALDGNSIVEAAGSNSFPIGLVVPKQITLSVMNQNDQWSEYDFYHTNIFLKLKFDLNSGKTETLNIGTFSVITPVTYGTVIEITAVNASYRLDRDYKTGLTYPVTIGEALRNSCATCGITLLTTTFNNSDFVIEKKPENLTHRQFVGLCAMIAGGNAKFDEYNRLEIITYDFSEFENARLDGGIFDSSGTNKYTTGDNADGGAFRPWTSGYNYDGGSFGDRRDMHILFQFKSGLKIEVDDVVITGVQLMDADKNVHLYGKTGYVLSLENQLAAGKEAEVAQMIGQKIVGLRFRPFTGDLVAYPMAEFGDLAYIMDYKSNMYQTVITDVDFQFYGFTTLKCSADSPIRNSSKYYGNEVKAIVEANKLVEKEKTEREKALEELAMELSQSSGLYMTNEEQADGSTIYYMHDKPTLAESRIVWKFTAEAFGISTDGGKTYPYGLDVTGMAILNRIYAIGIDCNYLTTGSFEIRKGDKVMVLMDKDTGQVILRPDVFELSNGDTIDSIAGKAAENAVDGQTQEDIFNKLFAPDGVPVDGVKLEDGKIYISASYIYSGTLTLGGKNNKNGVLIVYDVLGNKIVEMNNFGISVLKGSLSINTDSATKKVVYAQYVRDDGGKMYSYMTPMSFELRGENTASYKLTYMTLSANGITMISQKEGETTQSSAVLNSESVSCKHFSANDLQLYSDGANVNLAGTGSFNSSHVDVNLKGIGTTTSSTQTANLYINPSTGQLRRVSSSSKRYKKIQKNLDTSDLENFYKITPVWAKYKEGYLDKSDERVDTYFPMLIAEDVEKNVPLAANHNDEGSVEDWNQRVLIPYMIQALKCQKVEIDNLRNRLDEIEKKLEGVI